MLDLVCPCCGEVLDLYFKEDGDWWEAWFECNGCCHWRTIGISADNKEDAIRAAEDFASEACLPKRRALWISHLEDDSVAGLGEYTCSHCRRIVKEKSEYCPGCGFEMIEE